MTFFAAVWLPLMIIPCPLIKSIYLSSIRDRGPGSKKKKKKEAISQSSFGRHHLGVMRQLAREEVLGGYWNINIFLLWLRVGLFSKREPNGLRRSRRVRLLRGAASRVFRRQTWLKQCLPDASRGLFKSARAPDGWGLRHKTTPRAAGCAHIRYEVS